ncbi:hypothetical protein [Streptomyces sp. NPDC086787]|uniref:hypothetical protein n=1 Tax=Streptomyces sp. NPDC086787 TaxID=3365759 RepID=UPI0038260980
MLNRRKAPAIAVAAVALFSASFTQAAQASSGWDDLGSHGVYYQSQYRTKTVNSGGGDFKACITTTSSNAKHDFYNLYEEDKEVHDPKLVTSVEGPGCWVFHNLDDYVDGDNDRAELYIGTEDDPEMIRVHYYD